MANKVLLVFIAFDVVFLLSAGLHLFIPLYTRQQIHDNINRGNVAMALLLDHCPLTASMVNSVIMFMTFAVSIPAFFMPKNRAWLKVHAWGVVLAALLTLGIGLSIWYSTLQTKSNLKPMWNSQPATTLSLLQAKFQCCGYDNPALFVKDATCTSAAVAARFGGCETLFSVYANKFLDIVFTTFFGFVAVDAMLLLAALCLLKDRKEKERYRFIDEKRGYGHI